MQTVKPLIRDPWSYCLHKLFDYPSMIIIGGAWKTGKTDFGLKISEDLQKLYIRTDKGVYQQMVIEKCASNIETFGHYPLISDLISLKQWLYADNRRKLYIFDEASEHLDSRRAMSSKNVGFINLIPQISKAHARMIVIGHQLLRVDKTLLDDTYCRGVFIKTGLKTAQLFSHLLIHPYRFRNINATSVKFDPYAIAPFMEKPSGGIYFKDEDKQLLYDWSSGRWHADDGSKRMKINRLAKKFIQNTLEKDL